MTQSHKLDATHSGINCLFHLISHCCGSEVASTRTGQETPTVRQSFDFHTPIRRVTACLREFLVFDQDGGDACLLIAVHRVV
jgi:hypothetical protein